MSDPSTAALTNRPRCRLLLTTSNQPGAIAIVQLVGHVEPILHALTGADNWPIGRARFMPFNDIDEGIALLPRAANEQNVVAHLCAQCPRLGDKRLQHAQHSLGRHVF